MINPTVAISLSPPWGLLICANLKDCENRDWYSKFTGEVYIHQAKKWDRGAEETIKRVDRSAWDYILAHMREAMWYGVIGKCTFGKFQDYLPSKWFFGKYAWPCFNGVLFPAPVLEKGHLSFFPVNIVEPVKL
jgi:hypothetical protein